VYYVCAYVLCMYVLCMCVCIMHVCMMYVPIMYVCTYVYICTYICRYVGGDSGSTVVKVLSYKLEGHWFDPRWCYWNFSLT
jgi:hypothetical protein